MAFMQHMAVTTYTNYRNKRTELTEDELSWFYSMADLAKAATGCTVDIIPRDGEIDKQDNALGYICTTDVKNRADSTKADTFIAIDCYYIDEEWKHEFQGGYSLEKERLLHVIAHEIAHLLYWRHGEKHTALTETIYQTIMDYARAN